MKKKLLIFASLILSNGLFAETLKGWDLSAYGWIKTAVIGASESLGSFNNVNQTAPTQAAPHLNSLSSASRLSFQAQQSRIGALLKKNKDVTGRFEIDFFDINKSSPTTQMNPRLRIASITYSKDSYKFIVGQDWDLFSPVNGFTYSHVGMYFMTGNTGFMRQQVQILKDVSSWELGAALGLAGSNPGIAESDLEATKSPSYAVRSSYKLDKGRVGVSAIYSTLKYSEVSNARHDDYGINAFFEQAAGEFSLKSEVYFGQNLNNIGTLSLGKGTATSDVKELGGMFSLLKKVDDRNGWYAGAGFALITEPSELERLSLNASRVVVNPGIKRNYILRFGWEYKIAEDLAWFSEVSRFETVYKLPGRDQLNIAGSLESGLQLNF